LRAALPSGRGRSRILPGNDSLPYVLVPERCTRPRRSAIHDGDRNRRGDRKPDIRALAPIKRRRRTGRMAMVVLDRGQAIHSSCIRYVGVLTGWTWQSILAYCPREKVDCRPARPRTRTRLQAATRLDSRSNEQQPRLDVRGNLFRDRDELLRRHILASANRES